MDCPVCFDTFEDMYTVNCKSTVPHRLCHPCETSLRLSMRVSSVGRLLKCPICRTVEQEPGNRSASSFQSELKSLYSQAFNPQDMADQVQRVLRERLERLQSVPRVSRYAEWNEWILSRQVPAQVPVPPVQRVPVPPVQRVPVPPVQRVPERVRTWCQSGLRQTNQCHTKGKTARKCSYPAGCSRSVCRSCKMCVSHFEF